MTFHVAHEVPFSTHVIIVMVHIFKFAQFRHKKKIAWLLENMNINEANMNINEATADRYIDDRLGRNVDVSLVIHW